MARAPRISHAIPHGDDDPMATVVTPRGAGRQRASAGVHLSPATRCRHGRVVDWGAHGPDPRDGSVGAEVCVPCSPLVDDLRRALREIERITGDAEVRRIARTTLDASR